MEELEVILIRAENLKAGDKPKEGAAAGDIGSSDPFGTIYFEGVSEEQQFSSDVINKSLNPVWNFSTKVPWNPNKGRGVADFAEKLVIEIWDKDMWGKDFLGQVVIPAHRLEDGEKTYQLTGKTAKDTDIKGSVVVKFTLPPSAKNMNRQPPQQLVEEKKSLKGNPYLNQIAEKIGITANRLYLSLVLFVVMFVFFGFGARIMSCVVGVMYPMYCSFKAIKSDDKNDDSQWLTYWVVYGFISMVESFTDVLLFWIPFYYFFKMIFFVWLMHPRFLGAQVVYKQFVKPLFLKIQT